MAEQRYLDYEHATNELFGTTGEWLPYFHKKILSHMQSGDELWLYNSGSESWKQLHGENGLALIRNGQVVSFIVEKRN